MTTIITPPARLICKSRIPGTSFQLSDDLPELLDLLVRELLPPQQRPQTGCRRTPFIDLVDQFVRLGLLHGRLRDQGMAEKPRLAPLDRALFPCSA